MASPVLTNNVLLLLLLLMSLVTDPTKQSHETGPELFVEVLGTLATAADAAGGRSGGDAGCSDGTGGGVAPWLLTRGVQLEELLAFLVACFQQGGCLFQSRSHAWSV